MAKQTKQTRTRRTPASPLRSAARTMGRKPVPENETRYERFMRIGTKRMNNAIHQIQLLGNLCSPSYECDADDLTLMRDTILHELDMALARFSPRKRQGDTAFTFKKSHSPSLATTD